MSITVWYTLRALGNRLADDTTRDRTYIRHFNLPQESFLDHFEIERQWIPASVIESNGQLHLRGEDAGDTHVVPLAVG